MKLKNKISGEIKEFILFDGNELQGGVTLESLTKEWEDYKEPKEYWYLENNGDIDKEIYDGDKYEERMIEIGNYFSSREEAELAVEKLKAIKRLKDYNVKFNLDFVKNKIDFTYSINNPLLDVLDGEEQIFNNMKIVFGGEE